MAYLEELLPEFRKGAKIRQEYRGKNYFIQLKDGIIFDSYGSQYKFTSIDLLEDKWEFYTEPKEEYDWQYIIDHKCLCWFWRQDVNFNLISVLREITNNLFIDTLGNCWENCRPVQKDEVTFYEDKNDYTLF